MRSILESYPRNGQRLTGRPSMSVVERSVGKPRAFHNSKQVLGPEVVGSNPTGPTSPAICTGKLGLKSSAPSLSDNFAEAVLVLIQQRYRPPWSRLTLISETSIPSVLGLSCPASPNRKPVSQLGCPTGIISASPFGLENRIQPRRF